MTLSKSASAAALLCTIALAGCGDDSGDEAVGAGGVTRLTVGTTPVADSAWLSIGIEKGLFREEGLELELKYADGGAAIVPAVMKGDTDIGSGNTTSLIIARAKGLPIKLVSPNTFGGRGAADAPDAVMVAKDSSIRRPGDLEGKTVAVNTLNNIGPLTVNAALEKEGVDYRKVRYTEVPFPEMNAALEAGRVDAAWIVEPFVTQGEAAGSRAVLHPYEGTGRNFPITGVFVSEQFLTKRRDVVERFVRAGRRALSYAQSHPDEIRAIIPSFSKTPAAVTKRMNLPTWKPEFDMKSLQRQIDLAARYGFIEEKPALNDLVVSDL